MILVDYNQIAISSMMAFSKGDASLITQDFVRHLILNCLKSYRKKFKQKYGEIVLCCDGSTNWRKKLYPFYKGTRQKAKDKTPYDWAAIHCYMKKVREELDEFFPYSVVYLDDCEADDIIAVLSGTQGDHIIVSNDTDFYQLHNERVQQFLPLKQKVYQEKNPEEYCKEHIICGDVGDGIPNILSDDDTFMVEGKRQKSMTKAKLSDLMHTNFYNLAHCDLPLDIVNWNRNRTLVDFDKIPDDEKNKIKDEYNKQLLVPRNRSKLLNYFMNNGLSMLFKELPEF